MGVFTGSPTTTFAFLRGLREHNEKAWFDAHRTDYQVGYVEPAIAFIEALGPRLRGFAPELNYEARVNGSLFRIQRDTRISKDKTPYKTNLDLWFWAGETRGWEAPGCFFRLAPDALILGAGLHKFSPAQAARFREAVVDPVTGPELQRMLAGFSEAPRIRSRNPSARPFRVGSNPATPGQRYCAGSRCTLSGRARRPRRWVQPASSISAPNTSGRCTPSIAGCWRGSDPLPVARGRTHGLTDW